MNRRTFEVALVVAVLGLAGVAAVAGPHADHAASTPASPALLDRDAVTSFDEYTLFWAGPAFEGLEVSAVVRHREPARAGEPAGRDSVSFVYGDCDASQGSCAFPLEVQVWPACERHRSSYELAPGEPYPYEALDVRGVPAGLYDDGQRLELYTGEVTVVLFGDSAERLLRAAAVLRSPGGGAPGASGAAGPVDAAGDLPPPAPGALDGRLACTGA